MTLYLSQKKLFVLIVSAFFVGFALGFLYDGVRLFRTLRKPKSKVFRFLNACVISLEDFLFFTFGGIVMSIVFYVTNSGKVRPMAFVMAIVGFWLFRVTLSRMTYPLLVRLLTLVKLPLAFGFRLIKRVCDRVILILRRRNAKRFFMKLSHLGEKGYLFGIRRL